MDSTKLVGAGSWAAYWYNGLIVSSEIGRGLDILELQPSPLLSQNEIDAAKLVHVDYQNVQDQQRVVWPASFVVARAYVDQLERGKGLAASRVAVGLLFHPVPSGGFEERPSVLANTPWWGPIHVAIAAGFVLCALGGLLVLVAGGALTRPWIAALSWGAMAVGMVFFTGVALINGWVMHYLTAHGAPASVPLLYDAFNRL